MGTSKCKGHTAKFKTSHKRIALNIIQCYTPTNDADEELKEEFYQMLEKTTRKSSEKDITILLGDMNATVGNENTGYEQVMGKHGIGAMNKNKKIEKASEMQQPSCKSNSFGQTGFLFSRFINLCAKYQSSGIAGSQEEDF